MLADVAARDQQEQSDGCRQRVQRRLELTDDALGPADDADRELLGVADPGTSFASRRAMRSMSASACWNVMPGFSRAWNMKNRG